MHDPPRYTQETLGVPFLPERTRVTTTGHTRRNREPVASLSARGVACTGFGRGVGSRTARELRPPERERRIRGPRFAPRQCRLGRVPPTSGSRAGRGRRFPARCFSTLARKASAGEWRLPSAGCISTRSMRRIAANVRREQRRRTATEDTARVPEGHTADLSWREGLTILDEELARLPDRYRAVLIACCLDGRSRDEAARQLGCSEGQVKGLLERGRELLRQRLSRRGFDLGSLILAATVANTAVQSMPRVAVEAAIRVAQGQTITGGVSSAQGWCYPKRW